jgi:hypothetical protein
MSFVKGVIEWRPFFVCFVIWFNLVMPRPLILVLDGEEFTVTLKKLDRESLYGKVEIEAFDEKKRPAEIKVLAADGNTLIDKGGTALEMVTIQGDSIERADIRMVDREGRELETVKSSFGGPNNLNRAEIDDYLSLIVKSVYMLETAEDSSMDLLCEHLGDGQIFSFPFSYRDGIDSDEAFIVGNADKDPFMIIGQQATLQYLKLNQTATLDSVEEDEISADDLSFDLL